jgi:hypothetical protein
MQISVSFGRATGFHKAYEYVVFGDERVLERHHGFRTLAQAKKAGLVAANRWADAQP